MMVSESPEVTQAMFFAAATALAECVSDDDLAAGALFPRVAELRRVTARVAEAVVKAACEAELGRPLDEQAIRTAVAAAMWEPRYLPYETARAAGASPELPELAGSVY
jgi:malic enzyme